MLMKLRPRLPHVIVVVLALSAFIGTFGQVVVAAPTFATTQELNAYGTSTPGWRIATRITTVYMVNPYTGERSIVSVTSEIVYMGYFNGNYLAEEE